MTKERRPIGKEVVGALVNIFGLNETQRTLLQHFVRAHRRDVVVISATHEMDIDAMFRKALSGDDDGDGVIVPGLMLEAGSPWGYDNLKLKPNGLSEVVVFHKVLGFGRWVIDEDGRGQSFDFPAGEPPRWLREASEKLEGKRREERRLPLAP